MSANQFPYYTEKTFSELVGDEYDILESMKYAELEANDSIYFVLRKKGNV